MRWTPGGQSSDVEDRRGESAGGGASFGGGLGRMGPLGLGGVLLLLALSYFTGTDFFSLLSGDPNAPVDSSASSPTAPVKSSPEEERLVQFVSFVLDDVQNTWTTILPGKYEHAHLVLFRDAVDSACGFAQSATGPFYCPGDHKVYIDLGFYQELKDCFGASGEFAEAYVLAHELGHHVQSLLGTEAQVRQLLHDSPRRANDLSVRTELQADCYAGVWGHSTSERHLLDEGEVDQGLNAAAAIGDDRIQRMSGSRVSPETFTHGSSAQRVEWFRRGLSSGRVESCDTFGSSGR